MSIGDINVSLSNNLMNDTTNEGVGRPVYLIPKIDYKEQINNKIKPYIDEYNSRKKSNNMNYDFYNDHLHDVYFDPNTQAKEAMPMWHTIIICLKRSALVRCQFTPQEVIDAMRLVVEEMQKEFSCFMILGAKLYIEDDGQYRCVIDYKAIYENNNNSGLKVCVGHAGALKKMRVHKSADLITRVKTIVHQTINQPTHSEQNRPDLQSEQVSNSKPSIEDPRQLKPNTEETLYANYINVISHLSHINELYREQLVKAMDEISELNKLNKQLLLRSKT